MKKSILHFAVINFMLEMLMQYFFRPINLFPENIISRYLLESLPNIFSSISVVAFLYFCLITMFYKRDGNVFNKSALIWSVALTLASLILWEILHAYYLNHPYDTNDIIASFVGTIISVYFILYTEKKESRMQALKIKLK